MHECSSAERPDCSFNEVCVLPALKPQPSKRLVAIDCLRGMAAMIVVLHHATDNISATGIEASWYQMLRQVLLHGQLGVPLFFVISGFCIHLKWARLAEPVRDRVLDFTEFWQRRFWRLYPPYLVMLCASMTLVLIAFWIKPSATILLGYPDPIHQWIAADFLAHVVMAHGLHPQFDHAGGNPVYWTLAREEYFYALYGVLLAWRRRASSCWGILGATFALSLVVPPILREVFPRSPEWSNFIGESVPVLWFQWCLGLAAAEAYCGTIKLPNWSSDVRFVIAMVAAAKCANILFPPLETALWGLAFFVLLNWAIKMEVSGKWPRNQFTKWLERVGVFSYSLYLVHMVVQIIICQAAPTLHHTNNPWVASAFVVILSVASYCAGKGFFVLVERRFLMPKPSAVKG